ncbi:E3 ubiquitin-protein ligase ICP0 [Madurella mycetomatis]|uniref:E3 ubiquitin-protein ligase ICP0 n=1 Tax=Madurella mycetomatis TaxID=100816 RepID=A0A175VPG0_9PEZI|nr:E3 ubiquitin-protein ligase ICP0 [Madurella mycetomatis]
MASSNSDSGNNTELVTADNNAKGEDASFSLVEVDPLVFFRGLTAQFFYTREEADAMEADALCKEGTLKRFQRIRRVKLKVDDDCRICRRKYINVTVVLPCWHYFCDLCLFKWMEEGNETCPTCEGPLEWESCGDAAVMVNKAELASGSV